MPKVRALIDMPNRSRWNTQYQTRMLTAGTEFDVSNADARVLIKTGWAEPVKPTPVLRRTAQVQETAPAPVSAPEPELEAEDPYADQTVFELRELAEQRGLELHSGYVRKEELIEMLRKSDEE